MLRLSESRGQGSSCAGADAPSVVLGSWSMRAAFIYGHHGTGMRASGYFSCRQARGHAQI